MSDEDALIWKEHGAQYEQIVDLFVFNGVRKEKGELAKDALARCLRDAIRAAFLDGYNHGTKAVLP